MTSPGNTAFVCRNKHIAVWTVAQPHFSPVYLYSRLSFSALRGLDALSCAMVRDNNFPGENSLILHINLRIITGYLFQIGLIKTKNWKHFINLNKK